MPCYHPLKGYRSQTVNDSGKRSIVFSQSEGYKDLPVTLPCGQCMFCRLERSRKWAVRISHEAQMHEQNCFITLTYASEHFPQDGSLQVKHFQDFMKRLRKEVHPKKIRFFHCGEYGEKLGRPHYHAIIFGHDFSDKVPLKKTPVGHMLYESKTLSKLWPKGLSSIGDVTFESAAYVARYIVKKVTGEAADLHYDVVDKRTGEIVIERKPEYVTMSRRPGIGVTWFEKYSQDVFPHDYVVIRGVKQRVPKFYDQLLEREDALAYAKVSAARKVGQEHAIEENSWERLRVKEDLHILRSRQLKRNYESET